MPLKASQSDPVNSPALAVKMDGSYSGICCKVFRLMEQVAFSDRKLPGVDLVVMIVGFVPHQMFLNSDF